MANHYYLVNRKNRTALDIGINWGRYVPHLLRTRCSDFAALHGTASTPGIGRLVAVWMKLADGTVDVVLPVIVAYVKAIAGSAAAAVVTPELVGKLLGMSFDAGMVEMAETPPVKREA